MNPDRPDALQASACPAPPDASTTNADRSAWAVFLIFLRLGLTAFGGPVAHLAYFRAEFVSRRHWLSERSYSDLVALCQFLPGPASSQVGMAIGLQRAGFGGMIAASVLGIFLIPLLYVLFQWTREKVKGTGGEKAKTNHPPAETKSA